MKIILKLEELAMFAGCIGLFYLEGVAWWWYLLLFIGPDISMIGYLAGNTIGAASYNLFHHKAIGIVLAGFAMLFMMLDDSVSPSPDLEWLVFTGVVIFGHASMDRFFGYGLKYNQGFKYTHLGEIGKKELQ
jgi:Domain of unknown function (DUF4260)